MAEKAKMALWKSKPKKNRFNPTNQSKKPVYKGPVFLSSAHSLISELRDDLMNGLAIFGPFLNGWPLGFQNTPKKPPSIMIIRNNNGYS